jgi:hypothetical protein
MGAPVILTDAWDKAPARELLRIPVELRLVNDPAPAVVPPIAPGDANVALLS